MAEKRGVAGRLREKFDKNRLIFGLPRSEHGKQALPEELERELRQTDWERRDVLIGCLRSSKQLDVCLEKGFYHVPAKLMKDGAGDIRYVGIYQSWRLFRDDAGIRFCGKVRGYRVLPRCEIRELPRSSDEPYIRFEIEMWDRLEKPIDPGGDAVRDILLTNYFLLMHSSSLSELKLSSKREYRLYAALSLAAERARDGEAGFELEGLRVVFSGGRILVYRRREILAVYDAKELQSSPVELAGKIDGIIDKK